MTKHTDTGTAGRQAGAEIEITPEMVRAGFDAFWDLSLEDDGAMKVVYEVIKAALSEVKMPEEYYLRHQQT